jgi:RNA polymerase sigma factor (sigma-70 family)
MAESDEWRVKDVLAQSAWVRRLARRLVVDAADQDDVVQDAWIEALRHGGRARALRPWLAGVLRNLVRMERRSNALRRTKEEVDEGSPPPATPEDLVERVEIEREVATALLEIKEPYRSTLLWRYYDDLSAAEIARRSGVPAGTVRWRLKQGLEMLRAKLDARFKGDRRRWSVALIPSAAAGRGGLLKAALATVGGVLSMNAATKAIVALVILLLLALGGVQVWRHRSPNEVTRAQPGMPWRLRGGFGGASTAPTVTGIAIPSWFGQRGAPIRRIAGRVTFEGKPVAGATVELGSDLTDAGLMPLAKRQTSTDGRFDFGTQPPARFSVAASAEAHAPAILEVDTRNPTIGSDQLELRLASCGSALFGHVNDSGGGPIAAAQVCLAPPRASACVSTDSAGAYTICLSAEQRFVTVRASGYGGLYDRVEFRARRVQRDYSLTPEATIVGRVVRADGDAPAVGASVRVYAVGSVQRFSAPGATITDSQGRFTIAGLAPGRQRVMAFADGYASETVDLNVEAGRSSGDVLLRLRQASRLVGVVTDGHAPVVGAIVSLVGEPMVRYGQGRLIEAPNPIDAVTQSDGSFVIEPAARGRSPIFVRQYEVQDPKMVTIDAPEVSVRVLVTSMPSIAGRVIAQGKPLAGASVLCFPAPVVFSDSDGRYSIRGLSPGPRYRVCATNLETGAEGCTADLVLGKDEHRTNVDVDLKNNGVVSGVVVEADGKPAAAVNVGFNAVHLEDGGGTRTAADGTFRVTALTGGDDYRPVVFANIPNQPPLRIIDGGQPIHVTDGASEVSGVRLVIEREHLAISGTTVDENGNPMSDVRIVANPSEGKNADFSDWLDYPSAVSATDGRFSIANLEAGSFALRAHAGDGGEATVRGIAPGQKDVVIKLTRAGGIDGVLIGFSSQPAVQAVRQLYGEFPPPMFASVDGSRFSIRGLSPGRYQVAAIGADTDAQTVDVAPGQIATVTLRRRGSTTIRGRVVDWVNAAPVAGLRCYPGLRTSAAAMPIWMEANSSFTDDKGAFQLDDAPAGAVAIACDAKPFYYTNGRAEMTIASGQNATCEVPVVKWNSDGPHAGIGAMIDPGPMPPARIIAVIPRGPADRAGVRIGDIITTIDGANVTKLSPMGVIFLISQRAGGSKIRLELGRGDQSVTTDVVMAPGP